METDEDLTAPAIFVFYFIHQLVYNNSVAIVFPNIYYVLSYLNETLHLHNLFVSK